MWCAPCALLAVADVEAEEGIAALAAVGTWCTVGAMLDPAAGVREAVLPVLAPVARVMLATSRQGAFFEQDGVVLEAQVRSQGDLLGVQVSRLWVSHNSAAPSTCAHTPARLFQLQALAVLVPILPLRRCSECAVRASQSAAEDGDTARLAAALKLLLAAWTHAQASSSAQQAAAEHACRRLFGERGGPGDEVLADAVALVAGLAAERTAPRAAGTAAVASSSSHGSAGDEHKAAEVVETEVDGEGAPQRVAAELVAAGFPTELDPHTQHPGEVAAAVAEA